jgi:hypothetical protein
VEIRLHTEFKLPMLHRSGSFMVGETPKGKKNSMKLMASLDPARAEVEAGVVAKADQKINKKYNKIFLGSANPRRKCCHVFRQFPAPVYRKFVCADYKKLLELTHIW